MAMKLRLRMLAPINSRSGIPTATATSSPTPVTRAPARRWRSLETSFHQELNGAPTLTISNAALTVAAGGSVPLGVQVTPADADDTVSVTISGLTSYETITDNLDQSIFSGSSVTLSAAEVNSGLTLHSSYAGTGHPVNNLTLAASNTTTGEAASSRGANDRRYRSPGDHGKPAAIDFGDQSGDYDAGPQIGWWRTASRFGAIGVHDARRTARSVYGGRIRPRRARRRPPGRTSQQALLGGDKELLTRPQG